MLIATRKLDARIQGHDTAVQIRIFQPVCENEAWTCEYEIDWPSGAKSGRAVGVDAIQAILLALQKVGVTLYTSDYHKNGQLSWPSSGSGYGFPVPSNVRDLLIGEDLRL
jgi:uncharacterized protein DUF6968